MTDWTDPVKAAARLRASRKLVRDLALQEGLIREPTPDEIDTRRAESVVYLSKAEAVRDRINGILKEEGLEITAIDYGNRVVLTDGKSADCLDLEQGTWH
jgi:hypothetical protein